MRSAEALDYALGLLRPTDWGSEQARLVWMAICACADDGQRPDTVAVASKLRDAEALEKVGGQEALERLEGAAPDTKNIEAYVDAVRACAKRRAMLAAAEQIASEACGDFSTVEVDDWAGKAAESLTRIADETTDDVLVTGENAAQALFDKWQNPERTPPPLYTGIRDLDRLMRGMRGGNLIVVGAHSGVGKSAFAMNVGAHVLLHERREDADSGVLVFSLEMSAEELAERVGCSLAYIDTRQLDPDSHAEFTEDEGRRLIGAINAIRTPRWVIDERCDVTMTQIRAKARRVASVLRRQGTPLRLVVIDYAQIVSPERDGKRRDQTREQEVAAIGRASKKLARELNVAVIMCAQLNKDARKEGRKPRGSDLRESEGLLQDADKVLLLWNPAALERTAAIANGERVRTDAETFDVAEIIVDKHRGGRTGTVRVRYWPAYTTFAQCEPEDVDIELPGAPRPRRRASP
jgi:replicative DNA helicase